jgi:tyrosyl-tRNA synthetase
MSKSLDNFIAIGESPKEIYGKTLSIPDTLIADYFLLATDIPTAEFEEIRKHLDARAVNPRDVKRRLARELVRLYHSEREARAAEEEFDRIFVQGKLPDKIEECRIEAEGGGVGILDLLTETKLASSKGEARRLIEQGGVSIDDVRVTDSNLTVPISKGVIVKVGKRKFLKVTKA